MSVEFDPIFEQGEKLTREQVARELVKRIPNKDMHLLDQVVRGRADRSDPSTAMHVTGQMTGVLLKMLENVDEKYLTREFAMHGDIRPLLQDFYNDESATEQERSIAISLIPTMTDIIKRDVEEVYPRDQLDDDDAATLDAMINEWRGGKVSSLAVEPRVTTDPVTGESTISAPEGSIFSFEADDSEQMSSRKFISETEWRRMLRQGSDDVDSLLMQDELMRMDPSIGNGYVDPQTGTQVQISNLGVQYDDTRVEAPGAGERGTFGGLANTPGNIPEHIRNPRLNQNWYGVSEILNKPYELTREEAVEIHTKMKKAGIFEVAGGEPMVPGDVSDPAFKRAWKYLVSKSMSENKSMMSILEEQTSAYEAAVNAQLATQLTDPARIRLNANAMARSAIGRHLSEDEQAKLTQFIHDLERQNARMAAGLEETSDPDVDYSDVEGQSEGTLYDVDAQIDQWFEDNIGEETGARDLAESYTMFTSMLGGPGRGVS